MEIKGLLIAVYKFPEKGAIQIYADVPERGTMFPSSNHHGILHYDHNPSRNVIENFQSQQTLLWRGKE
jgi:hypothetical protein